MVQTISACLFLCVNKMVFLNLRKEEITGYYPSMYLQKAGEENMTENNQLRNKAAPPRRYSWAPWMFICFEVLD